MSDLKKVEILDAGTEGKAIARVNDMVVFVPFVAPGDIVDIRITSRKKNFIEGIATEFHHYSDLRQQPFCPHFGTCGGCKWQHMKYEAQLHYKQKQVEDNLVRIGKFSNPVILPILPSEKEKQYRNKLEFTFCNRRFLTENDASLSRQEKEMNALGFHVPKLFDKVIDIQQCDLQREPSNAIRNAVREYVKEKGISFSDFRNHTGMLRNLVVRTSNSGETLVIVVFRYDEEKIIHPLMDFLKERFPEITSLYYIINHKQNDTYNDLECILWHGKPSLRETMPSPLPGARDLAFDVGPVSFYQTNTFQGQRLYKTVFEFAGFTGSETVYDLYTGTGTIAIFIAGAVKKVTGIESVAAAIGDAKKNASLNGIMNAEFITGIAEKMLNEEFLQQHGVPDVIITDPPRAGMHEKVTGMIMDIAPSRVVYISCNPSTQARDMALMKEKYDLVRSQPLDMFPHTQHVENVALLEKKS